MTYTHRNGETGLPTAEGWYWFGGLFDGRKTRGLVKANAHDWKLFELEFWPAWIDGWVEPDVFRGQWWGPIPPPW